MGSLIRKRFIFICSLAFFLVVLVTTLSVNGAVFLRETEDANRITHAILDANGVLPSGSGRGHTKTEQYFSVAYVGNVGVIRTNQTDLTSDEVIKLADSVRKHNALRGYHSHYRYEVRADKSMVVLLDCEKELNSVRVYIIISVAVSAVGIVIVFFIIFMVSKRAIKPYMEAYQKQGRFITEASHELKTPLTIISANNELLEMQFGENEFSTAISKQLDRMTSMVSNLTSLARLDEARKPAEWGSVSFSNAVEEIAEQFRPAIENELKDFIIELKPATIMGDSRGLAQLVSILLDNATKYSRTFVKVSLTTEGKRTFLTVSNDADNVGEGNLSRCFERFFRSDEARTTASGSGLGLAMAEEIVSQHKGTISAFGHDGVFTIKVVL